MIKGGVWSVSQ